MSKWWRRASAPAASSAEHRIGLKQSTSTSSTKGKKSSAFSTNSNAAPNEDFFDMIQRMQSKRIDDQRCDPVILNDVTNKAGVRQSDNISIATDGPEAILDLIALIQGRRMEEQRAHLVLPGLNNPEQLLEKLNDGEAQTNDEGTFDHEHLYEMVLRCQADRLEDQRSELGGRRTMTIPEEDISMLVMKMQAGRLEEQRAHLTRPESVDTSAAQQPAEEGRAAEAQNPKN